MIEDDNIWEELYWATTPCTSLGPFLSGDLAFWLCNMSLLPDVFLLLVEARATVERRYRYLV